LSILENLNIQIALINVKQILYKITEKKVKMWVTRRKTNTAFCII